MKKFILKLDLHDDKEKRKALKTVSTLSGIDSIIMNMKEKKMTVVGSVDPITVVSKLRKFWPTDIMSVGPAKEPEKKEEPKKEEGKKEEEKKEDGKEPNKDDAKKEGGDAKEQKKKDEGKEGEKNPVAPVFMPYRPYYPPIQPFRPYYQTHPNVIEPYKPLYQAHQPSVEPYKPYYNQARNHSIEENPNACVIC